jgi:hypothetical protein
MSLPPVRSPQKRKTPVLLEEFLDKLGGTVLAAVIYNEHFPRKILLSHKVRNLGESMQAALLIVDRYNEGYLWSIQVILSLHAVPRILV